jgi:hypothetical protein
MHSLSCDDKALLRQWTDEKAMYLAHFFLGLGRLFMHVGGCRMNQICKPALVGPGSNAAE